MNPTLQLTLLITSVVVSGLFLRRALPAAFADPARFPQAKWGWAEGLFSAGLAGFFLMMAAMSMKQGTPARVDLTSVLMSAALYAAMLVFVTGFLLVRGINPITAFGLNWKNWRSDFHCIPSALLLVLPFIFLAQWAAYRISGPDSSPQAVVSFLLENPGWRERGAVALVAVIAAPITEELIFRGCLYGTARAFAGRLPALVFSSVVFALIHGHLPSLPGLFVLSVALVFLYERTGSLWAPIALHALFNSLTIVTAIFFPQIAG